MKTFGDRIQHAMRHFGPVCVGIDPHPGLLGSWGLTDDVDGVEKFAEICVEAFDGTVALVKPQVAFFEAYGSGGIAVLERTIEVLRASGTLVLADAKRGDIGSTMDAYARAWLADGPLGSDAVTVSPYLGFGSLAPALALAQANRRGVFVLAATSNPEGAQVQSALTEKRPHGRAVDGGRRGAVQRGPGVRLGRGGSRCHPHHGTRPLGAQRPDPDARCRSAGRRSGNRA